MSFVLNGAVRKGCGYARIFAFLLWILAGMTACGRTEETVFSVQEEDLEEDENSVPEEDSDFSGTEEKEENSEPETALICVFVSGAVVNPGVYELPESARVVDALTAAGGLREDADPSAVNQAARLTDGMQLYFPTAEEAADHFPAAEKENDKVNINEADAQELMTLNGIGAARAEAIIAYRETNGPFRTIDEIRNVNGIKDAVFEKIQESITVG